MFEVYFSFQTLLFSAPLAMSKLEVVHSSSYATAIQALNYYLAFIGCINHAVLTFIQADVLAYLGIASLVLWKQGTEAAPTA